MRHPLVLVLLGLLGGVGGAFAVRMVAPPATDVSAGGDASVTRPDADLLARIAALEEALATGRREDGTLRGREGVAEAAERDALLAAVEARLAERLDARVNAGLDTRWKAWATEKEEADGLTVVEPERKPRPRLSLAEAAAEIQLAAADEDELRRIYAETEDKMMKILAGEDGDVDAVRRDLDEAKGDRAKQMALMGKYMPRVMPKIGEFIGLQMEKQARVVEAVGEEKAAQLRDYDIIEDNPFQIGGEMRLNARTGR